MKNSQKHSGFSIIEIAITVAVIGMMIIGLSNLMVAIGGIQRQSDNLSVATRLAEAKIESLRNNQYNTLVNGTIDFSDELPQRLAAPRSGTVSVSEPSPGLKRLDIDVSYRENSRTKTVRLSAIIGNIGISQ